MDLKLTIFLFDVAVFFLLLIVQLLFPVEVYERIRESNQPYWIKGKFARTVEALYRIKSPAVEASAGDWGHILLFNGGVSLFSTILITAIIIAIALAALGLLLMSFMSISDDS